MFAHIYFKLGFVDMALCKLLTLLCMNTELLFLEYMLFVLDLLFTLNVPVYTFQTFYSDIWVQFHSIQVSPPRR